MSLAGIAHVAWPTFQIEMMSSARGLRDLILEILYLGILPTSGAVALDVVFGRWRRKARGSAAQRHLPHLLQASSCGTEKIGQALSRCRGNEATHFTAPILLSGYNTSAGYDLSQLALAAKRHCRAFTGPQQASSISSSTPVTIQTYRYSTALCDVAQFENGSNTSELEESSAVGGRTTTSLKACLQPHGSTARRTADARPQPQIKNTMQALISP